MAVIECVCPPKADGNPRHPDGDEINLRDKLPFQSALAARNTVILMRQEDEDTEPSTPGEILAALTQVYLFHGIKSWTLTDAKGRPIEPNRHTIRAFIEANPDAAMAVGDEADGLYSEAVITPLVVRASKSLPPTPIDASTSVTNGPSPAPRKPSKRSSTTTTPTEGTATISALPVGGYNS